MQRFAPDRLQDLAVSVMMGMGCQADEARLVADHLVRANLAGHDSHGVGMLPAYVRCHGLGLAVPNQTLTVAADFGALLVLDARHGFGQRMAAEAVQLAMARARDTGACVFALRDSMHIGRLGTYAELAAEGGMAFIGLANVADHHPTTAPFGCAAPRLGTNPFVAGVPGGTAPDGADGHATLLLDMATSAIAFGKARVARNAGKPVPEGTMIDAAGRPTTDPTGLVDREEGALLAFGLHKGSGLAVLCEVLGAAAIGGSSITRPHGQSIVNSMLGVVVDVARLSDRPAREAEVDAVKDWIKAAPVAPGFERILLPGEPEAAARAERRRTGIAVDAKTLDDIMAAASQLGLDAAALRHGLDG